MYRPCKHYGILIRGVWPGEEFGNPGLSVDEEMDLMRNILLNPVAGVSHSHIPCPRSTNLYSIPVLPVSHLLDGEGSDSDEDGGGAHEGPRELEFDFKTYLQR